MVVLETVGHSTYGRPAMGGIGTRGSLSLVFFDQTKEFSVSVVRGYRLRTAGMARIGSREHVELK